jgi:hypothetical protein
MNLSNASKHHRNIVISFAVFFIFAFFFRKALKEASLTMMVAGQGFFLFQIISFFLLAKALDKNKILWIVSAVLSPYLIFIPAVLLLVSANKSFKANGWKVSFFGGASDKGIKQGCPFLAPSQRETAKAFALKWAFILFVGSTLGSIIGISFVREITGQIFAEKVIAGVFLFPILFLILWAFRAIFSKGKMTADSVKQVKLENGAATNNRLNQTGVSTSSIKGTSPVTKGGVNTDNPSAGRSLTTMSDDAFYDEVAKEIETNKLVPGVWTRAFAEADGDESRAKAIYIKLRVAQLAEICRQQLEEANRTAMPTGGDEKAVSWEVVNDRWVKNTYANGYVTMSDKNTGRMWLFRADICWKNPWAAAVEYCNNLTYAGYSDWRLPSDDALAEQFSQKRFFTGVQKDYYWAGAFRAKNSDYAWTVHMGSGNVEDNYKAGKAYVWPVRGGQQRI